MLVIRALLFAGIVAAAFACAESDPESPSDAKTPPGTTATPEEPEPASQTPPAEVLAAGAAISGANGIHFGPDGLLYVASVIGSELIVLDPETGEVKRRLSDGVDGPDDVAFDSRGAFYWTSILTGEVAGMRPDGSRVTAAKLTPGVNPITFSPDDRLFVAQCFFGDKLYELDPEGVKPPRLISEELGPGCGLNGMDWGPDGRLYGPRWFRGEIVSFDVDTREMRTEASGFAVPAAVKFDSKGALHVLDTAAGAVVRVDGDERTIIAQLDPGLDNFAFDAEDRLFVSSFVDGFVARVEPDGGMEMLSPRGMAHPGGLTLRSGDGGPEVVVADLHAIRGYDADSGEPTFVHRNVLGVGEMGGATNVAADGDLLILTSWLDGAVRVWNPGAQELVEKHLELSGPVSAIRYDGEIVVTEHGKGRVIAIGADGIEVVASNLPAPTGLAVRGDELFVSDRERGEILRIAQSGTPLENAQVVASGLSAPEGIATTATSFIVVEGDSGRVLEIDGDGKSTLIAEIGGGTDAGSPAQPPSMVFNGVAVGEDGVVFATGETGRVLYRMNRP